MTMLGADLDQLSELAGQLRTTGGAVADVNTATSSETTRAVADARLAAESARTRILGIMEQLSGAVGAAHLTAQNTTWTGQNKAVFDGAYEQYRGTMATAAQRTNDAFSGFVSTIDAIAAELEAYVADFGTAMNAAADSVSGMATAVDHQREHLDAAMSGLTLS